MLSRNIVTADSHFTAHTHTHKPGEDITFMNWHSKGDVMVAGSSDASVWMWNAASGTCPGLLVASFKASY